MLIIITMERHEIYNAALFITLRSSYPTMIFTTYNLCRKLNMEGALVISLIEQCEVLKNVLNIYSIYNEYI